jgi:hypothetical protein
MPNVNATVTGTVAVSSITGNIAGITANVNIGTMPNVNANITGGNVTVTQGTSPWVVSGNVNANVTGGNVNAVVTGTVAVSSITSNVTIVDGGGSITVDGNVGVTGNVNIGTMPNVNAAVSGTVAVSSVTGNIAGITSNITVVDGGGSLTVDGNVGVTGNVNIGTMPNVNAAVTGTVAVSSVTGNVAGITANVTVVDGGGSLTIDGNVGVTGNVNIGTMPSITGNVNANVTGGNVTVTQGTSPWVVSGNVNTTITGSPQVTLGGNNLDAFARLRVSNPYTFFDSALSGERRYDWSSATATGGTVTFDFNANVRNLNVTAASGSEVIRESIWCFPYQPGKSLLIMSSFCMSPAKTGLRQRVGYFGAANGIYFEQTNSTKNLVIRSSSSGSLVEERIAQANWNTDKLNGTGPSGLTLDTNATQIFWTDIEWLGVGSVRTGFLINGQFITCHIFNHANDPAFTTTYMGTATLPCRYEITNTGATSGASTLKQICTTVISEGGYTMATQVFTAGTGINVKRLATAGTYYPIASIRLNSTHLNSIVRLEQVDMLSPTVHYYRWVVLKNATLTGATFASASSTSRVDVDTAATAVSGGTEMESGYLSSRELATLALDNIYGQLSRTLAGVSDTFTLALTSTSNNADVLAQIGWQEIL